ncbi:MAG: branched-chain amino acid transporter permease [Lachnospiraceae bacterium]|nr:branched-chain amino acid transporter permease [Lachnospiraceae bacterium]
MPISVEKSLLIIVAVAVTTFSTRAIPFLLFPKDKEIPDSIKYIGKVLPPAVIGMLIIYCFKSVNPFVYSHGLPELIAAVTVIVLHVWKRNNLLSIGVGTVLYMFLIQRVF